VDVQDARGFIQGTTEDNFRFPLRVADAVKYVGTLSDALASDAPCNFEPVATAFPYSTDPVYDFKEEDKEEDAEE
jgi:hypothetical protein